MEREVADLVGPDLRRVAATVQKTTLVAPVKPVPMMVAVVLR
jgi:hypothetical protein